MSAMLLFAMAAVHIIWISEGANVIKGSCGGEIRLPCEATNLTKEYRYVIWYKTAPGTSTAIIKYKENSTTKYNDTRFDFLRDNVTLGLHNAQPSESGTYKCFLGAKAGNKNYESLIELNISECVHMNTVYPSIMTSTDSCPDREEITVPWAVLGLSLFSIGKIILCIVTVGVCDRVIFRTKRRKQEVRGSVTGTTPAWKNWDAQKS